MFGESCLPKKQRRRDEAPLDVDPLSPTRAPAMVCDDPLLAPATLPPTVSYKEAMMGDLAVETEDDNDLVPLEDDDIDLLDDDDVHIVINERTHNIEYESLLMVCFNCGIYGHISDHYPKTHPHEPSLESDATMIDTPIPQPPPDPYGPWMLTDKWYNPIVVETEPVDQPAIIIDNPVSEPNPLTSQPMSNNVVQSVATTTVSRFIHVSSFSAGKSKPKGKAPIALRKAPLTVLKLRYTNIIPKKVGGVGPTRKSTLNLAKHSVIVTSESGQPIVLG
ncbi:hypothetical protein V6N13_103496 [Hibiscus sabdariffa]